MAIKTKAQLAVDIAALGATYDEAAIEAVLEDMVDSYEDIFPDLTTAQRNALTPVTGQTIYNTDNDRYEYWNGASWFGIGQDLSTPMTVKVDLSAADLAALHTTPVVLVAAPGAGYSIMMSALMFRFTYGSAVYDFANPLNISYDGAADEIFNFPTAVINNGANLSGNIALTISTSRDSIVENADVIIDTAAAKTTGDGTLTFWITYSIVTY